MKNQILICSATAEEKVGFVVAADTEKSKAAIANPELPLVGIFVDPGIEFPFGLRLIRAVHQNRPGVPVFLFRSEALEKFLSAEEITELGVQKVVDPVKDLSDLEKYFNFETDGATDPDPTPTEKEDEEQDVLGEFSEMFTNDYTRVRIMDLLSKSNALFDVYIRLSSGKYLKVLHAGAEMPSEQIQNYAAKGVEHLYIKTADQAKYLDALDKAVSGLMSDKTIPPEMKYEKALNYGEEVASLLESEGMSAESLKSAKQFAVFSQQILHENQTLRDREELQNFLQDVASMEHGVSTSIIAGIILSAENIDWKIKNHKEVVALTCLLHDIGLHQLPKKFWHEDESQMTAIQKKLYRRHPEFGAEILAKFREVPREVVDAVGFHHSRLNKKGFPERKGTAHVDRVAEVVGFSDEVARIIKKKLDDPEEDDPVTSLVNHIYDGFSQQVVDAFKLSLLGNVH